MKKIIILPLYVSGAMGSLLSVSGTFFHGEAINTLHAG